MNKYTTPKKISPFNNYKRIPRKLKKKLNNLSIKNNYHHWFSDNLDLNQKLWYIMEYTNKEYKQFIINNICLDLRKK